MEEWRDAGYVTRSEAVEALVEDIWPPGADIHLIHLMLGPVVLRSNDPDLPPWYFVTAGSDRDEPNAHQKPGRASARAGLARAELSSAWRARNKPGIFCCVRSSVWCGTAKTSG
jgi:hypothetical protein